MRQSETARFEIEGAEMVVRLAGDRKKPAASADPWVSKLFGIVPEGDRPKGRT